jgi:uncharacterized membrane protein YfcA
MTRPARPLSAFGLGAAIGTAGGLIGLGGAEFRLPALVGALRFAAREAVAVNLLCSVIVLAAAFPFRAATVLPDEIAPHLPAVLGMLAGSMSAAWIGAGWLRRASDRLLGRLILILLVALGLILIAEGLFKAEPTRLVGTGLIPTVLVAAACGVVIGLVSSLLGVAGGEVIIPVFILLFGVDVKRQAPCRCWWACRRSRWVCCAISGPVRRCATARFGAQPSCRSAPVRSQARFSARWRLASCPARPSRSPLGSS